MIKRNLMRIYTFFAALLVRAIVRYCTARGKYVDYVHATGKHLVTVDVSPEGMRARANSVPETRVYMRRYVITGFMTGDQPQTGPGLLKALSRFWAGRRWHLYLHHMHAPDADACLHDHPWPWAVSWVLLGGYLEARQANARTIEHFKQSGYVWHDTREFRWLHAPALNVLRGTTFHRISELDQRSAYGSKPDFRANMIGTFTLFLAGPRRANKAWGYLVPGRGFVPQRERHAEMGASERRAEQPLTPASGRALDKLAAVLGLQRKAYGWWIFSLEERDATLRARCVSVARNVNSGEAAGMRAAQRASFIEWFERRVGQ